MNELLLMRKEFLTTVDNYQRARKCGAPKRLHVTGAKLRNFDLRGIDLTEVDFEKCDLSGANLSGAKLMASRWTNCQFGSTNLTDTELHGAIFGPECNFEEPRLAVVLQAAHLFPDRTSETQRVLVPASTVLTLTAVV